MYDFGWYEPEVGKRIMNQSIFAVPAPIVAASVLMFCVGGAVDVRAAEKLNLVDQLALCKPESLIGLAVGIGTRRADTGLNATNSFLKGCLEGIQK